LYFDEGRQKELHVLALVKGIARWDSKLFEIARKDLVLRHASRKVARRDLVLKLFLRKAWILPRILPLGRSPIIMRPHFTLFFLG
jgi:hypothetical protein